jgi:hypothetical protein
VGESEKVNIKAKKNYKMDQALVFWEKYFKSQTEVTWDELASSFSQFILEYGNLQLDEDQLFYLKSILDPDYRNIVKVAHFLIFQETVISSHSQPSPLKVLEGLIQEAADLQVLIQRPEIQYPRPENRRSQAKSQSDRERLSQGGSGYPRHQGKLGEDFSAWR